MSACARAGLCVCEGVLSIFFLSPSNTIQIGIQYRYDF